MFEQLMTKYSLSICHDDMMTNTQRVFRLMLRAAVV